MVYLALPFLAVSISSSVHRELSLISRLAGRKKKRIGELEKAAGGGAEGSCHKVS